MTGSYILSSIMLYHRDNKPEDGAGASLRTNAWLAQPHQRLMRKEGGARMEMACLVCVL